MWKAELLTFLEENIERVFSPNLRVRKNSLKIHKSKYIKYW